MSGFKFDPSQSGLWNILEEWEELALRSVWDVGEDGANPGLRSSCSWTKRLRRSRL